MRYGESASHPSDDYGSHSSRHRILFSRNNTYNSDFSLGGGGDWDGDGDGDGEEGEDSRAVGAGTGVGARVGGGYDTAIFSRLFSTTSVKYSSHPYHAPPMNNKYDEESIHSLTHYVSDLDHQHPPPYPSYSHQYTDPSFLSFFYFLLFPSSSTTSSYSWNYFLFSLSFSLSCAPVICSLIYAPAIIGNEIGALGNGCFYLSYALFTLLFGKISIQLLGCVKSFLLCHLGTFIYILCFILYSKNSFLSFHNYYLYFTSTVIGGIAQGLNWIAHSKYYSKSCQMMLTSMNSYEIKNMNRLLSFQFAWIYFIILIGIFIGCTLVIGNPLHISHKIWYVIIPVFFILHILSWILYLQLDDYGDIGEVHPMSSTSFLTTISIWKPFDELHAMITAIKLLPFRLKLKLFLLIPYHIAWGFCTTYWIYYILGVIVREEQGLRYISVAAVIDLTVSLVYTKFSNYIATQFAQSLSIIIGTISMITLGLLLFITSNSSLGRNKRIIGYLLLHGISRSVYESNMKAVVADIFMDYDTSLFIILMNTIKTISCGIAYLIYALIIHERLLYAEVVITLSFLALIGYLSHLAIPYNYRSYIPSERGSEYSESTGYPGSGPTTSGGISIAGGVISTTGTTGIGTGIVSNGIGDELLRPRLSSTSSLNSEMLYVPEYF